MDLTVYWNGELLRDSEVPFSVYDHGLLYGDGIRVDVRVYRKHPLQLAWHLETLFDSAAKCGLHVHLTDKTLEKTIRVLMDLNSYADALASILVTRGVGQFCLDANLSLYPSILIMTMPPVETPKQLQYEGVGLALADSRSVPGSVFDRSIFTLSRQKEILALYQAHRAHAFEALLVNLEGQICEGAFSNVFFISGGKIFTPDQSCGVRPHVMRRLVMEMARRAGTPVVEGFFSLKDLYAAEECFITSTEWEILPVVRIDHQKIHDGRVGKVTDFFIQAFRSLVHTGADFDGSNLTVPDPAGP